MGTKERADECAFECGRTSLLFHVSDLLEYLERADLDGTFAVNILHLQLSVFEPHRLLFNLNSLHGRGATNRRVGSPASIPPAEIAFRIFGGVRKIHDRRMSQLLKLRKYIRRRAAT